MKSPVPITIDELAEVRPPQDDRELAALMEVLGPVFRLTPEQGERYAASVKRENFRLIRWEGELGRQSRRELAGGMALLPMAQFFGGRSVPMTGVALVGVAPEFRAKGAAKSLMAAALREMHASSPPVPLSVLYPATLRLYRSVGYEQAGSRFEIRIPLRSGQFAARDSDHEIRRIAPADQTAIRDLQRRRASAATGNLDRSDWAWARIRAPRGEQAQGYCAINPASAEIEGYIYLLQKDSVPPAAQPEAAYSLVATDAIALTPAAGRKLLNFVCGYRSLADELIYHGGASDTLLRLLPERFFKLRLLDHWMLRIVDVGAALKARGYPAGLSAEIHLDVEDDLLTSNNGRYVLNLDDGAVDVESGGRGDIRIDIRGLASLYSGFATPHDLLASGHLTLSPQVKDAGSTLASAAAAFAISAPWMSDAF